MLIKVLYLCNVHTQVVNELLQNLEQGIFVNGSIGQVVAFQSFEGAMAGHTAIAEAHKPEDGPAKKLRNPLEEPTAEGARMYPGQSWPVVRFLNGRTLLITPGTRSSYQIPSRSCWSVAIFFSFCSRVQSGKCQWSDGSLPRPGTLVPCV
jgi:hypothetical protein